MIFFHLSKFLTFSYGKEKKQGSSLCQIKIRQYVSYISIGFFRTCFSPNNFHVHLQKSNVSLFVKSFITNLVLLSFGLQAIRDYFSSRKCLYSVLTRRVQSALFLLQKRRQWIERRTLGYWLLRLFNYSILCHNLKPNDIFAAWPKVAWSGQEH